MKASGPKIWQSDPIPVSGLIPHTSTYIYKKYRITTHNFLPCTGNNEDSGLRIKIIIFRRYPEPRFCPLGSGFPLDYKFTNKTKKCLL